MHAFLDGLLDIRARKRNRRFAGSWPGIEEPKARAANDLRKITGRLSRSRFWQDTLK